MEKNNMLWVDKYRPTTLDKLTYHADISEQLRNLAHAGDFPHLLFYGASGAGKKTRVMAFLREFYGPGVDKLKVENRSFKFETKEVELTLVSSNYHIELNPSDAGNSDRLVCQELIKEIAASQSLDSKCKVVVLNEVEKMSRAAQAALRRTMEKYVSSCRFVLLATNSCKVIEPVRSRCLAFRIPAPSTQEVQTVLLSVAKKSGIELPPSLATRIAENSQRNLRRAILDLQIMRARHYPFVEGQVMVKLDWEQFIAALASEILEEQSPQRLFKVRAKLYELLTNCIPPSVIFRHLSSELAKRLDSMMQHDLYYYAAYFEHRCVQGSKVIFHLEAFVAKFMAIYKAWLIDVMG